MSLVNEKDYDIRYTQLEDEKYLKNWLIEPATLDNFTMCDEKEVGEMLRIWIGYSKYKCSLTASYKGTPCGVATLFLMPYVKLVHHSLVYLVVDPKMRGKGIGTSLLANIEHLGKNYFRLERLCFEVYGEDEITHLLKKQGYQKIYTQERYLKRKDGTYKPRLHFEKYLK